MKSAALKLSASPGTCTNARCKTSAAQRERQSGHAFAPDEAGLNRNAVEHFHNDRNHVTLTGRGHARCARRIRK